jgi:hypothetical protein
MVRYRSMPTGLVPSVVRCCWDALPLRGPVLAALAALAPFAFAVFGAFETSPAAASSNYGKVTVSGSVHRAYVLSTRQECRTVHAGGLIVYLDRTPGVGLAVGVTGQSSTHPVNLAKSKAYVLTYSESSGASWRTGWLPNLVLKKLAYYGSGTLRMSKNGKSGSVRAIMTPDHSGYPPGRGTLHVTASWHCP